MSTVVVGEIPVRDFALAETFSQVPEATFEGERVVDHADDVAMPLVWARDGDGRRIYRALRHDPSTEAVVPLADFGDQQLYRVTWNREVREVLDRITESAGTILDVRGDATSWQFRVFYPSRESLSITNGGSDGISFAVNRVGQLENKSAVRYGLTDKQHEALRVGWRQGYFDVPRDIGIEELSSNLGITHQAVSERLRRGQSTLIKEALGLYGESEEVRAERTS